MVLSLIADVSLPLLWGLLATIPAAFMGALRDHPRRADQLVGGLQK